MSDHSPPGGAPDRAPDSYEASIRRGAGMLAAAAQMAPVPSPGFPWRIVAAGACCGALSIPVILALALTQVEASALAVAMTLAGMVAGGVWGLRAYDRTLSEYARSGAGSGVPARDGTGGDEEP